MTQFDRHRAARKLFSEIDKNRENYLIIHYSCESFYDIADGRTPRITSIAVYNYQSAQTESFSLHKVAEKEHVSFNEIEDQYDNLERAMLEEFFTYAREHKGYRWIHWNMRDMSYGFKAIEHRFSILGGEPYKIPDSDKIDLSRKLIECYGSNYIGHPRMEKLLEHNKIGALNFLNGREEAEAFERKEYAKLHMSTLRKVDVFATILNKTINGTLKVQSRWRDIYGVSVQGLFCYCKDQWWAQLAWSILMLVAGVLLGRFFA